MCQNQNRKCPLSSMIQVCQDIYKRVQLLLCIVIMHRRSNHLVKSSLFEIYAGRRAPTDTNIDPLIAARYFDIITAPAVHSESNNAAFQAPSVVHLNSFDLSQLSAQSLSKEPNPIPNSGHTNLQRIIHCYCKPCLGGEAYLVGLIPSCAGNKRVLICGRPPRPPVIQHAGLAHCGGAHVQHPSAARGPEVLAPGGRQEITLHLLHVHRHLANTLASVQKVECAILPSDASDLSSGVDNSRGRWDVSDCKELHSRVHHAFQGRHVQLSMFICWDILHSGARLGAHLEHRNHVGCVFHVRCDDPVSRLKANTVECCLPCNGCTLHHSNLARLTIQKASQPRVTS
mmetsp:Transcript_40349/g.77120  ORF Transcript_40349/g.77120 Transcript_40349/m.77120 type:complete len:343 (-) Transcript_40349:458-1486(-)